MNKSLKSFRVIKILVNLFFCGLILQFKFAVVLLGNSEGIFVSYVVMKIAEGFDSIKGV